MPHINNEISLTSVTKHCLNRLYQERSDTLAANANVHDEFAKVCPKSKIVGAREAEDLRTVFPYEGQPMRGTYCLSNTLFRPPGLPKSRHRLHEGSNEWNI